MPAPAQAIKKAEDAKKLLEEHLASAENTNSSDVIIDDTGEPDPDTKSITDDESTLKPAGEETPPADPSVEMPPAEVSPDLESIMKQLKNEQQKYKTLQGMFDKEIKPLRVENETLRRQNLSLSELIATNQQEAAQKAEKEKESPQLDLAGNLTPEQVEDLTDMGYDPDGINIIGSVLLKALGEDRENLSNEITSLKSDVNQTREERFFAVLTEAVPDWEKINNDVDFFQSPGFLDEEAPYTGMKKRDILHAARDNLDSKTVINIFSEYKASKNNGVASTEPPAATNKPHVAPATGPSPTVQPGQATQDKKIWTIAEIHKYHDDVRKGKYKGKEALRDKLKADMFQAQFEGRISAT